VKNINDLILIGNAFISQKKPLFFNKTPLKTYNTLTAREKIKTTACSPSVGKLFDRWHPKGE